MHRGHTSPNRKEKTREEGERKREEEGGNIPVDCTSFVIPILIIGKVYLYASNILTRSSRIKS